MTFIKYSDSKIDKVLPPTNVPSWLKDAKDKEEEEKRKETEQDKKED